MKKAISILFFLVIFHLCSQAQFYKSLLPSDAFGDSLTLIVKDFKNNFYPIQGKQYPSEGMVDIYNSKAAIPGSEHCIIQRYHSVEDTTASWQAIMYDGESYVDAVKIYKNIFHLVKKSKIKWADKRTFSFDGAMEIPDESVRFTSSPLTLKVPDQEYKHFIAAVEITNSYSGWEVHVNLHSRKNDEDQH